MINSSVGQRLESHALLAAVRHWPHRGFTVAVPPAVTPTLADQLLPPAVPEATGPAEMWWYDRDLAVQLELHSWWEEDDTWAMRCFTRQPDALDDAVTVATRSLPDAPCETTTSRRDRTQRLREAPFDVDAGRPRAELRGVDVKTWSIMYIMST